MATQTSVIHRIVEKSIAGVKKVWNSLTGAKAPHFRRVPVAVSEDGRRRAALLAAGIVVLLAVSCAAPALAAVSGSTAIGQSLSVVNTWKNDAQLWLPVICVLAWVGTGFTVALEGFRLNAALGAVGGTALASTFILAGPTLITALATLLGYSGAVI